MEQSSLQRLLKNIKNPQPLPSFIRTTGAIKVNVFTTTGQKNIVLKGMAPFHTLEDLQRVLWYQLGKPDELFPAYTYFSFQMEGREFPALYVYSDPTKIEEPIISIPNPVPTIQNKIKQDAFVDQNGDPRNPAVFRRGRISLQDALVLEYGAIPTFSAYSFRYLLGLFTGPKVPLSSLDWYGLFYPYFPNLNETSSGQLNATEVLQKRDIEQYVKSKLQQVQILEQILQDVALPELQTTGIKYLQFQWTSKENEDYFEGVDALFFSQPVNHTRPFMRLLTPNGIPMTKLFQPNPTELPVVSDPVLLKVWTSEENPVPDSNILYVKSLLRRAEFGAHALYGTLRILDDTTADFTIEAPKDQRILDMNRDLRGLESAITAVSEGMPYALNTIQLGRAHMRIELNFEKAPPKNIQKLVKERMSVFTTLFQETDPEESEQKSFASYRYKGVSNFSTPNRIYAYLNYMITRKQFQIGDLEKLVSPLAHEFEITQEKAQTYIADFINQGQDIAIKDTDANEFISKTNPGVDITISAQSVTSFTIQLYNIRRCDIQDIRTITTILSLCFYSTDDEWSTAVEDAGVKKAEKEASAQSIEAIEKNAEIVEERVKPKPQGLRVILPGEEEDENGEENTQEEAPAPAQPVKGPKEERKKEEKPADDQLIIVERWFNERLKQLDKTLFGYTPPKGGKNYSRKCPPNQDRYPFMLNLQQYTNMLKIYAPRIAKKEVAFIEYGTQNTAKSIKDSEGALEKITVLRYGSDPSYKNLLYFLCHTILCLKDLLPILKIDWDSDTDYYGKKKEPKSCPFCHGKEVKDREHPKVGETVFIRGLKPSQHAWINFLKNPEHPGGFELPCCFVSRKDIPWEDHRFDAIRQAPDQPPQAINQVAQERVAETEKKTAELKDSLAVREQLDVPYDLIRWKIAKDYILGTEKYPLDSGKVGLLSPALDSFFGQNSPSMVSRVAIKQEFLPTAHGFFRIGVNNRVSYIQNSLFAALAPMLGLNTVKAVQDTLTTKITARAFISLNFGNLVLEFYNPKEKEVPAPVLSQWAQKHLTTKTATKTIFEIARCYNSYENFKKYITDDSKPKQLRHFVHALAEPGLLTKYGLSLLTLHYKGDPHDQKTQVEVLCPMMGFDMDKYASNTVGFLTYSDQHIWEPLVYLHKLNPYGTTKSEMYYTISQGLMESTGFPTLVKNRYQDEFLYKCASAYRGAYTFQSGVDNRILVPLSRALNILRDYRPSGVVRDIYNHIVAITLQNPTGKSNHILIPVVDDGNIDYALTGLQIHLGVASVDLASANDTYKCYEEIISNLLYPISNIYKFDTFLAVDKRIVGFRIGGEDAYGAITMPCGPMKPIGDPIPAEYIQEVQSYEFEYEINNEIIKDLKPTNESGYILDESNFLVKRKQVETLYEHFRLSFSKWVSGEDGSKIRKDIEDIIQYRPPRVGQPVGKTVSKVEKMQKLQKKLAPTLESWFLMDTEDINLKNILLKKDCISIQEEGQCTDACKYDQDDGECKIHSPPEIVVATNPAQKTMIAAKYFVMRLLDELIRLPIKRQELLEEGIQRIQVPATNIHIGTQWILPENTPAWYDLLRENTRGAVEAPEFYEEFSRPEASEDEYEELKTYRNLYPVPDQLLALLPEPYSEELALEVIGKPGESRVNAIRRYFGLPRLGRQQANRSDIDLTWKALLDISSKYKMPVIQVQITQDPIVPLGRLDDSLPIAKTGAYVIIPDFEKGPAILVKRDDITDVIPKQYLKGALLDSIEPIAVIKRKKLAKPSNLESEPNSNNDSNAGQNSNMNSSINNSNSNSSLELENVD